MKQWLILMLILPMAVMLVSCEEEVPDYAADIINTYIVESITEYEETFDLTALPLEESLFIVITRDEIRIYQNDEDHCLATYEIETEEISGVTETAILYMDDSADNYSFENGKLRVDDDGDIVILAEYTDTFPPPAWTDPSLLNNDTYEPNNEFTMATAIAAGGTVQNHYLAECDEKDYFMFNAESGTSYSLGTTTPFGSSLDLELTLYTGSADSIDYNDDYNYPNLNPGLDWTCPATGDYYFLIQSLWGDEFGDYSVSVNVLEGLLKTSFEIVEKQQIRQEKSRLYDLLSR